MKIWNSLGGEDIREHQGYLEQKYYYLINFVGEWDLQFLFSE